MVDICWGDLASTTSRNTSGCDLVSTKNANASNDAATAGTTTRNTNASKDAADGMARRLATTM